MSDDSLRDYYRNRNNKRSRDKLVEINIIRVGMYRRVSTQEQVLKGQSLEIQKLSIEDYILSYPFFKDKEVLLFDFVDDGRSAKDLNRPGFHSLKNKIELGELDYVMIVKLDRITRRILDLYTLMELFNKYNVQLISLKEQLDTQSAHGRFFITILGSLAQLEREQTAERVYEVFKKLITTRHVGGKAPFGYFHFRPLSDRFGKYLPYLSHFCKEYGVPPIQVNNDLIFPGAYVPRMFRWYLSFENLRLIARNLTELRIPQPSQIQQVLKSYFDLPEIDRKEITSLTIEKPKKWIHKTVCKILVNPFYTGERVWNRWFNLEKRIREIDEWIFVPNSHPPLVDLKIFQQVEQKLV
ncbi:MAG: recombinase family protein [Candidatus Hodarchaeales archaeon]